MARLVLTSIVKKRNEVAKLWGECGKCGEFHMFLFPVWQVGACTDDDSWESMASEASVASVASLACFCFLFDRLVLVQKTVHEIKRWD